MLELFRKNTLPANLLLLLYAAILHIHGLINGNDLSVKESGSPLFNGLAETFSEQETLARIMYILFIFIFAVNLNRIAGIFKLSHTITAFPGYFFVTLSSLSIHFLPPNPILFGSFFVIVSIMYLFRTESPKSTNVNLFNAGFFLTFSSLLFPPYFFFIVTFFLAYLYLKKWTVRAFLQFFMAFLTPFFLLGVYYLTVKNDGAALLQWIRQPFQIVRQFGELPWQALIPLAVYFLILITHLVNFNVYQQKKNVMVKRKFGVLYLSMLSTGFIVLAQTSIEWIDMLILSPFLGLLLGILVGEMKNKLIAELLNLFLLSSLLFLHYYLNS